MSVEDMMEIEAPWAETPSAPMVPLGSFEVPSFDPLASQVAEFRDLQRAIQDTSFAGRRQAHVLTARLHRADASAQASVASIRNLPSLKELMGDAWNDVQRRYRLYDAGNAAHYVETVMGSLSFMSFLERGVLTADMPVELMSEIPEHDDERYLHGLIHALHDLQRYAVNRGQALDLRSVRICLRTAQCLEQALMQFDFRNSDIRRRFDSVKYIVKRLETVAYEVDLAHQRAEVAGNPVSVVVPAEGSGPTESGVRVLDTARIWQIKDRYDEFDQKREQVIKRSRDVIKSSKNAIYALQRTHFKKADADLGSAAKEAGAIYEEIVSKSPALRGGLFSASVEELCEALLLRAFLKDRKLLSHPEVQSSSGLPLELSVTEYLGGVMDLTGEVCRVAVKSVSRGRQATPEVEACLGCVDAVYTNLQLLPVLPGGIDKKMGALRLSLQKVETVLYELSLLSQNMRAEAPEQYPDMDDAL